ncbi:SdpI family protein [Schlesneria paludicola]|uniref:SdpI family protein n=1 Tax=Schlesneria paludicola TaxID=360056 RepID=UPI00029B533C|nr:SdpI family protein [Schlesneria paludicola]
MRTQWRIEAPQLFLLVAMFTAAIVAWPWAPVQIPVHWNLAGEVDRFGSRLEGLFILPVIATGLYLLLRFLPRIDPARVNYPSFAPAYTVIRISLLIVMTVIHGCLLFAALGYQVQVGQIVPIVLGAMFITLGNVMGKLRPNWFVGVRTPWTLSSRRSWNKTHRLAGWLFVAMGVAVAGVGVIASAWTMALAIAVNMIAILWMVIYSYLVWRGDPDRLPATAVSPENTK